MKQKITSIILLIVLILGFAAYPCSVMAAKDNSKKIAASAKTITVPPASAKPTLSIANYRNGIGAVWSNIPNAKKYNVF